MKSEVSCRRVSSKNIFSDRSCLGRQKYNVASQLSAATCTYYVLQYQRRAIIHRDMKFAFLTLTAAAVTDATVASDPNDRAARKVLDGEDDSPTNHPEFAAVLGSTPGAEESHVETAMEYLADVASLREASELRGHGQRRAERNGNKEKRRGLGGKRLKVGLSC